MNGVALLLLAFTLAAALVDWLAVATDRRAVVYLAKPLTMLLLIGVALTIEPVDGATRTLFVLALVFSLLGDVFLMLPRNLFVAGLSAFLIGHVLYIAGLQVRGQTGTWFLAGLVVVVVAVLAVGVRILRAVRTGDDPAMAGPVSAYLVVISFMVASAFGTRNAFAIAGAGLFYASDALLAWNRFVAEKHWAGPAIMMTYHLGQVGLVLSLV
jgi:uncharacterized membrane protein YhhN